MSLQFCNSLVASDVRSTSMGSVRGSSRGGKRLFANRLQLSCAMAACLVALGNCGTGFAEDAAAVARPGALSQERLNAAAQDGSDFLVTHGNYAQTRYHPADRINTKTVKDLKLA